MTLPKPINVLIVASDTDYIAFTARLGTRYHIQHSRLGAEAISRVDGGHLDVLIVTDELPDMSGSDLLARFQDSGAKIASILIHEQFANFPTESAGHSELAEHLSKPVGEFTLMKAIDDAGARMQDRASS